MDGHRKILINILKQHRSRGIYNLLNCHYPYFINTINEYGERWLNGYKNVTFTEKMYCYIYTLYGRPKCISDQCNNPVSRFYSLSKGYALFCSNTCVARDKTVKQSRKETLQRTHSIQNYFNNSKKKSKK